MQSTCDVCLVDFVETESGDIDHGSPLSMEEVDDRSSRLRTGVLPARRENSQILLSLTASTRCGGGRISTCLDLPWSRL